MFRGLLDFRQAHLNEVVLTQNWEAMSLNP